MNRFLLLVSLLVGMVITSAGSVQATSAGSVQATSASSVHTVAAGPGQVAAVKGEKGEEGKQHPRLVETRSWQEYNYETREFEIHFEVDYVAGLDYENSPVVNTVVFSSSSNPYDQWEVDWNSSHARLLTTPLVNKRQLKTFENYTLAVINCRWRDAHAYDNANSWNPNSPIHISDYAYDYDNPTDGVWFFMLGYIGHWGCGSHAQEPPPPMGIPAPVFDDSSYQADSFGTLITLLNGTEVDCSFGSGDQWALEQCHTRPDKPSGIEADQLSQFISYTLETLHSCENSLRFISGPLHFFGEDLLEHYCNQQPVCEATAVPHIDDLEPGSPTFFYVTIQFEDGIGGFVTQGYAFDGERWQMAEQDGDVPNTTCEAQLDTFTDYTMGILTSATCTAVPVYTPDEEAAIAWYVQEIGNFCQTNQRAPKITGVDWHAPTLFVVDVQLQNGQTMGIEFEEHNLDPEPQWDVGQYFEPGDIVGAEAQAELFVAYTLQTLNSCVNSFAYPYTNPSLNEFIGQLIINFCIEGGP